MKLTEQYWSIQNTQNTTKPVESEVLNRISRKVSLYCSTTENNLWIKLLYVACCSLNIISLISVCVEFEQKMLEFGVTASQGYSCIQYYYRHVIVT